MNILKDHHQSLAEIYEIAANVVEVVRSSGPPMCVTTRSDDGIVAVKMHARRFRVIAARVLRGPCYMYLASIEELIDLPIDGREARVWRDVSHHFSTASAQSVEDCIDLALSFINSLMGAAHVFVDPNF